VRPLPHHPGRALRRIGSCRASGVDGTASLADRDFGRVSRTNRRKVFSPVPRITQMKPQARAIPSLRVENPKRRDSVAERSEFELPVPFSILVLIALRSASGRQPHMVQPAARAGSSQLVAVRSWLPYLPPNFVGR